MGRGHEWIDGAAIVGPPPGGPIVRTALLILRGLVAVALPGPQPSRDGNRRHPRAKGWRAMALIALIPSAWGQYSYSPYNPDEQGHNVRYFGSAKDNRGALIPGVMILLYSRQGSFIFVTDDQGRFHDNLPFAKPPDDATVKCVKTGFEVVQIIRRPGPTGEPRPTVQVDCVLRPAKSGQEK